MMVLDINDRPKLLALAAKAQGWIDYPDDSIEQGSQWYLDKATAPRCATIRKAEWCPFDDDAQALRLAVALGMFTTANGLAEFQAYYSDEIARDRKPTAATRRAIVVIAAYQGLAMSGPGEFKP